VFRRCWAENAVRHRLHHSGSTPKAPESSQDFPRAASAAKASSPRHPAHRAFAPSRFRNASVSPRQA
jgi:hypothetical protein